MPTTAAPTTNAPTATSPGAVPSCPPSGIGCLRSGATVYVYNLPATARCAQAYRLPAYSLVVDTAVNPPPTWVALSGIPFGTSLAIEVYGRRNGAADCANFITHLGCQV